MLTEAHNLEESSKFEACKEHESRETDTEVEEKILQSGLNFEVDEFL